jgi:oxygen-independent coproporphyrinogen-3 oxidase
VLRENGRNHLSKQFYTTFANVRETGFDWINCDIMSGMLGITDESWKHTVVSLVDLKPENVAIYKMEVYFNTKLFKKIRHNPKLLIEDEAEASHFEWARNYLESNGYFMWDCFSFATKPEYIHRHRRNIQSGGEMLGIGLSSHSYFNGFMFQNTSDMSEYAAMIESGRLPVTRAYKLTAQDEMVRYITFGLKNLSFDRQDFVERFGADVSVLFPEQITTLLDKNMIVMDDNKVALTPKYYGYADDIARIFYPQKQREAMLAHISR